MKRFLSQAQPWRQRPQIATAARATLQMGWRSAIATATFGVIAASGVLGPGAAIGEAMTADVSSSSASGSGAWVSQATSTPDAETGRDASSTATTNPRFTCQYEGGEYVVMYTPESQPSEQYAWASPGDMGGGWSADRRCAEISRRLETYRPDGLLELRTGVENGYNTVCATTEEDAACRIVFTVPNGQDPTLTRDRVFENLAVANSGQETDAVSTYRSGGNYRILERLGEEFGFELPDLSGRRDRPSRARAIDLRPFLDPADGGTGTQLRSSTPARLNPGDFR